MNFQKIMMGILLCSLSRSLALGTEIPENGDILSKLSASARYKPDREQNKLLEELKTFAKKNYQSDLEIDFHEADSLWAGSVRELRVVKPEAYFYRTESDSAHEMEQFLTFLKKNKELFQVDEETIDSLVDLTPDSRDSKKLLQTYQGIPVFSSGIRAAIGTGVSLVYSALIPSKNIRPKTLIPIVTPEKVVAANWSSWSVIPNSAKKNDPKLSKTKTSYSVKTKTFVYENEKKVLKNKTATVHLVIYPTKDDSKLAWCFSDFSAVYDALTGELLEGERGPKPENVRYLRRTSSCPSGL